MVVLRGRGKSIHGRDGSAFLTRAKVTKVAKGVDANEKFDGEEEICRQKCIDVCVI